MTVSLQLLVVAVLILLNGFFVAAEYSLVTVRRTRLRELADEGSRPARAVMRITSDPPHFIAAMKCAGSLVIFITARAGRLPSSMSSLSRVRRTVTSEYSAATKKPFKRIRTATPRS